MIRAIRVIANDDYSILATLEDGRTLRVDMRYLKSQTGPVVETLKDIGEFKKVFVRNGIVTWPSGYDIDPYYLVENGSIVNKTA